MMTNIMTYCLFCNHGLHWLKTDVDTTYSLCNSSLCKTYKVCYYTTYVSFVAEYDLYKYVVTQFYNPPRLRIWQLLHGCIFEKELSESIVKLTPANFIKKFPTYLILS